MDKKMITSKLLQDFYSENKSDIDKITDFIYRKEEEKFIFLLVSFLGEEQILLESSLNKVLEFTKKQGFSFNKTQDIKDFITNNILVLNEVKIYLGNQFETVNLLLLNRLIIIDTGKEKLYFYAPSSNDVKYFSISINNLESRVFIDNGEFITLEMKKNQENIFTKYLSEISKKMQSRIDQDIKKLRVKCLSTPPTIDLIIKNFIGQLPQELVLSPDGYIFLDNYLNEKYFMGKALTDNKNRGDSSTINIDQNRSGDYIIYQEQTYKKLDSLFGKLLKLLPKYINIQDILLGSFVWMKIIEKKAGKFSDDWKVLYGDYFKKLNFDLNEYIRTFCGIQEIDHDDYRNIGMFVYFLVNLKLTETQDFLLEYQRISSMIENEMNKANELRELESFEKELLQEASHNTKKTIQDIDLLTGLEFEVFIAELFNKMGYRSEVTKFSGDQGIDVIVERNTERIGIQAKRYNSKVNNKAVQEIVAGLAYYNCKIGMIISNNYFTESAMELAFKNNIILWDRDMLTIKLNEYY